MIFPESDADGFDGEIPESLRPWFESQREKQQEFEKNHPLMKYYILVNGKIKHATLMEWAKWFEDIENRLVDRTEISKDVYVSTIFLGIDHSFKIFDPVLDQEHRPILFETMVMGGKYADRGWRYSSHGEAKRGHWTIVDCIRKGLPPNVEYGERPFFEEFMDMMSDVFEEDHDDTN
jgi:hypothetical protein